MQTRLKDLVLMAALMAGSVIATAQTLPDAPAPILTVHTYNRAGVEQKILMDAEAVTLRVFGKAGLQLRYVAADKQSTRASMPGAPSDIYLSLLSEEMAHELLKGKGRPPNAVMGMIPCSGDKCGMVYVFWDIVETAEDEQINAVYRGHTPLRTTTAQLLGCAIAHEIGHALNQTHSGSGIMRAHWNLNDLQSIAYGSLAFTPQQASKMRAEVTSRHVAPTPVAVFGRDP